MKQKHVFNRKNKELTNFTKNLTFNKKNIIIYGAGEPYQNEPSLPHYLQSVIVVCVQSYSDWDITMHFANYIDN